MKNRGVRIRDSGSICESVMRFRNVPAANGEICLPNVAYRYMVRHSSGEFSAEQHLGAVWRGMFGRPNHCL